MNILIVDDHKNIRIILSKIVRDLGFKVFEAEDGKETLKKLCENKIDILLLDYALPDTNGLELLKNIMKPTIHPQVIMVTGHGNIKQSVQAMKIGAADYLTKPIDNEELAVVINKCVKTIKLNNEIKDLRDKIHTKIPVKKMMGESAEITEVLKMVNLVADKDITVLLEGNTGTGKDLIANLIHQKSDRRNGPFVPIDLGALPESLFESELFGHEKGTFTGASSKRIGKFEEANGGTLFLDEINNLPVELQKKFLRAIENREIQRLGCNKTIKIDARIIVATNKKLMTAIQEGKFREDLFYRLQEFKIEIPDLTRRKNDIPVLVKYFIKEANVDYNLAIKGISIDAMEILMKYSWPGNVRELRNTIRRGAIHCKGNKLQKKHMTMLSNENLKNNDDHYSLEKLANCSLPEFLAKVETKIIRQAMKYSEGNKSEAAKLCGVSRWSFYRKLKEMNIE